HRTAAPRYETYSPLAGSGARCQPDHHPAYRVLFGQRRGRDPAQRSRRSRAGPARPTAAQLRQPLAHVVVCLRQTIGVGVEKLVLTNQFGGGTGGLPTSVRPAQTSTGRQAARATRWHASLNLLR